MKQREIKFRAWDAHTKRMIYFENDTMWDTNWLETCYAMQYTGLKDNKRTKEFPDGQEIYEGDIVDSHAHFNDPYIRTVIWNNCGLEFKPSSGFTLCKENEKHFQIIGNIYKNPELLEQ